ncbi:MAG: NAD-dependent protein deacetylase [Woeseiaceae bacterium]|nr:NAD-dependent protein deacetylase [Woeseiaceae bacterium]
MTDSLRNFLADVRSLVVLSGAGVSTGSGIPDYRDRNGDWKHSQPIQFGDFMANASSRRRYWARSYIGWRRFSGARPNAAHHALARLEQTGKVDTVITQNVDRLHSEAGSRKVIDLHGDLSKVRCMSCEARTERSDFQVALEEANPGWTAQAKQFRADGDAELVENAEADFNVPGCTACNGILKPDVVMFGENVPQGRVDEGMQAVERADALLVVGSSLMVFSGFRFARRAGELGKPLAIVNRGRTRADDIAGLKVDEDCASVLPAAVDCVAG